ncbi:hypothetical protein [uncultured Agrobacterium sp.]|uniref:hypothetical protein n=1 Tax=uncultured Agrobacterium sp. TaxID=157277 RepID=UPI000DD90F03|nr:hypothetical protein [uncultured Agrobacterium sp.]
MTVRVIEANRDHVDVIAPRMREADREEVFAAVGRGPASALLHSLERSDFAHTVLFDDVPELMFGCGTTNILTRTGAPWLLGTDALERHARDFLRGSLHWVAEMRQRYTLLQNVVDDRNVVSKRWLQWLGFTLSDPQPFGYEQRPFRIFEMKA